MPSLISVFSRGLVLRAGRLCCCQSRDGGVARCRVLQRTPYVQFPLLTALQSGFLSMCVDGTGQDEQGKHATCTLARDGTNPTDAAALRARWRC